MVGVNVILPASAPRDEWLAARKKSIGASDVGAMLGLDPWRSPYALWLEKTGRVDGKAENEAMQLGHVLEPVVAQLFREAHGPDDPLTVDPSPGLCGNDTTPFLTCTPDYIVTGFGPIADDYGPLEVKAPGLRMAKEWRGDEAPARYLLQVQAQHAVLDTQIGWLAALLGGQTYVERRVDRDEELVAMVVAEAERWWTTHVLDDKEPPVDGDKRTTKLLEAAFDAAEGTLKSLGSDWSDKLAERRELLDNIELLQGAVDRIDNELRQAMGDATHAHIGDSLAATWKPHTRTSLDSKALRANEPDIAAKYTRTTTVRPLVIK